jgi:hypothetical protein
MYKKLISAITLFALCVIIASCDYPSGVNDYPSGVVPEPGIYSPTPENVVEIQTNGSANLKGISLRGGTVLPSLNVYLRRDGTNFALRFTAGSEIREQNISRMDTTNNLCTVVGVVHPLWTGTLEEKKEVLQVDLFLMNGTQIQTRFVYTLNRKTNEIGGAGKDVQSVDLLLEKYKTNYIQVKYKDGFWANGQPITAGDIDMVLIPSSLLQ